MLYINAFNDWKKDAEKRHTRNTQIIETSKGPVQYVLRGMTGPCIALNSGSPGGYDQALLMGADIDISRYRMLAWSRPGYLGTPPDSGGSLADQAEVLLALIDALNIEQVILHGASGGGPISYYFAQHFPGRTIALITECAISYSHQLLGPPATRLFASLFLNNLGGFYLYRMASGNPAKAMKVLLSSSGKFTKVQLDQILKELKDSPEMLQMTQDLINSISPMNERKVGLKLDIKICEDLDNLFDLELIKVPTIIFHGENDSDVPPNHARHAANKIPKAKLVMLQNTSHLIPLSGNYALYVEEKQTFLNQFLNP